MCDFLSPILSSKRGNFVRLVISLWGGGGDYVQGDYVQGRFCPTPAKVKATVDMFVDILEVDFAIALD